MMERDDVINLFNDLISGKRREITFTIGYKVFEEVYDAFASEYNLNRSQFGYLVVITVDKR